MGINAKPKDKPLAAMKAKVLDPETGEVVDAPRQRRVTDESPEVLEVQEVDIPEYRPPANAPQRGGYPSRPPAYIGYTSPVLPEPAAPKFDPSDLADLMASLVAGDPLHLEELDWKSDAPWFSALRALVKKGFVATVLYTDDAYRVTVRR